MSQIDDFLNDKTPPVSSIDAFLADAPTEKPGPLGDLVQSLKSGVQQLPGTAAALADLPFALTAGARPFTRAADALGEATGFQPGKWAKEGKHSDQYAASQQDVGKAWAASDAVQKDQSASGMDYAKKLLADAPDIASAYLRNPMYTANQVAESLPGMVAGGVGSKVVRGLGAVAGKGLGAEAVAAGAMGPVRQAVPGYVERAVGSNWVNPVVAGIGEGAITAGQSLNQATGEDQQRNALSALGAGVGTGLIGMAAGRVANSMGLETAGTAMAKAGDGTLGGGLNAAKRISGGALTEGVFEELPQSVQEAMWQNYADGKPLMEGVARQGVEGALAGAVMGAGANVINSKPAAPAPQPSPGDVNTALAETDAALADYEGLAPDQRQLGYTPGSGTIQMPRQDGQGVTTMTRSPDTPLTNMAIDAEESGLTASMASQVGPLIRSYATPQEAEAAMAEREDADRVQVGRHPRDKTRFSVLPKSAQALAAQDAKAAAQAAAQTRTQQVEDEDGNAAEPLPPEVETVDMAAHAAASSPLNDRTEPTERQIKAGNYAKGHISLGGLKLAIENPVGSVRRGTDPGGAPWQTEMNHHYGYVKSSTGADGSGVDAFVKGQTPVSYAGPVFVIDQVDPRTGNFDEHKSVIGATTAEEAKAIYLSNYAPGWQGMGTVTEMPFAAFKAWVRDGVKDAPLAPVQDSAQTELQDSAQTELQPAPVQPLAEMPVHARMGQRMREAARLAAQQRTAQLAAEEVGAPPLPKQPKAKNAPKAAQAQQAKPQAQTTEADDAQSEIAQSTGKMSFPRVERIAGESDTDYQYRVAAAAQARKVAAQQGQAALGPKSPPTRDGDLQAAVAALGTEATGAEEVAPVDEMPDVKDAGPKALSRQMAKHITQVARVFGKRVVFIKGMKPDGMRTSGNTIYLNTDSSVAHLRVLGHELLHALKAQKGDAYAKLLEAVKGLLTDEVYAAQYKNYFGKEMPEGHLNDTTRAFLAEEWLGDLSGNRFAEAEFWNDVFGQIEAQYGAPAAKGIIARLRLALVSALNKLLALVNGPAFAADSTVADHLTEVRKAIADGFATYAQAVKTGDLDSEAGGEASGEAKFAAARAEAAIEDRTDISKLPVGKAIPESVALGGLESSLAIAKAKTYTRGRQLKVDIQDAVLAAAKAAKVDLQARTQATHKFISDAVFRDAKYALRSNENAIGWYDQKISRAIGALAVVHPEINTDQTSRLAFLWSLAVTSNGQKVNKNFELAEKAYRDWKASNTEVSKRVFPASVGIGNAASAINDGMALFNTLSARMEQKRLAKFMATKFPAGDIVRMLGVKAGGEWASTPVRGAAILGPKIGNGFYMNLNGYFEALTMDRWLMRTYGRLTGTLLEIDQKTIKSSTDKFKLAISKMTKAERATMSEIVGTPVRAAMSRSELETLAAAVDKVSMKPEKRAKMQAFKAGDRFRLDGRGLAQALDGQKEAPSGPAERNWIRAIFTTALARLKADGKDMTMSDLQALLWYPERRLYDAAKADEEIGEGYEDDEAPDYANAAMALAIESGASKEDVLKAMDAAEARGTVKAEPMTEAEKTAMAKEFRAAPEQGLQLAYEVAPDPDDKASTEAWNTLDLKTKTEITTAVKDAIVDDAAALVGAQLQKTVGALGGFMGEVNPNLISEYQAKKVSLQQARTLAAVIGYALDQNSVAVVDSRIEDAVGLIRITFSGKVEKHAKAIFEHLNGAIPEIQGFTARGNNFDILNFTEMSNEELANRATEALGSMEDIPLEFVASSGDTHSELVEKDSYEGLLQGSRPGAGQEVYAGAQRLRDRARAIVRERIAESVSGSAGAVQRGSSAPGAGPAKLSPERRTAPALVDGQGGPGARAHAVSIAGVHFSQQARTNLDGRYNGRGLKGAEAKRLANSTDARIKERVYFYVDEGNGIRPESGVGGVAHAATLDNLYNVTGDPLKLFASRDDNANETALLDAGYDGYYVPKVFNNQGVAVVLGKASRGIAVAPTGYDKGKAPVAAAEPYKRSLMSAELGKLDMEALQAVAPSAKLRSGNLTMDATELPAARAELAKQGIDLPEAKLSLKRWFGEDSTLVNEDGSPMVLYHGTTAKNERALGVFRRSKIGAMGPAIYLGDSKEASAGYADGAMMQVYARGKYLNNMQWTGYISKHGWAGAEKAARADGFSGVYDSMFENAIAVWDPQDIKSATKNNGDFDPQNPDIRYSNKRDSKVLSSDGSFNQWPQYNTWTRDEYEDVVSLLPPEYREDPHRQEPITAKDWDAHARPALPEIKALNGLIGEGVYRLDDLGNIVADWRNNGVAASIDDVINIANKHDLGIFLTGIRTADIEGLQEAGFVSEFGVGGVLMRAAKTTAPPMPMASSAYNNPAYGTMMSYKPRGFALPMFSPARKPFYSALSAEVGKLKLSAAPAFGWRDAIKGLVNKGLVKQDEVEWTGLNDWLDLQSGKVAKELVQQYLDANGVKVTETTLGGKADLDKVNRLIEPEGYTAYEDRIEHTTYFIDEDGDTLDYTDLPEYIQKMVDKADGAAKSGPAKFGQYVVPGGENYREVLLTLPVSDVNISDEIAQKTKRLEAFRELQNSELAGADKYKAKGDALEAQLIELRKLPKPKSTGNYRSSHWDAMNVLAHLRLDDRTDADGNQTLFVQEIQSDWGQNGKRDGFAGPDEYVVRNEMTGKEVDRFTSEAEAKARVEGKSALSYTKIKSEGLPVAPFVTGTDKWLNLALKRVIKMAVDGGYDKVAFANGEQNAKHYDLSKEMDTLLYDAGDGSVIGRKDGGNVITKTVNHSSEIADLVGKDIAERLLKSPKNGSGMHELKGLELKMGGEGMRTFYDKIVPIAAGKLAAKLGGGKVEAVRIGTPGEHRAVQSDADGGAEVMRGNETVSFHDSMAQAQEAVARLNGGTARVLDQPGITITDKMRESAAGGLPMFSNKRTFEAPLASSFDDVVYKLQDRNIDTKRVVEAITKSVGKIADNINVYLQEELFHGRAAKRVADFGAQELKPLMTLMRMNDLDVEAVEEYLHARHAREANALIASREPSMPDGGSGMTNAAAAAYLAKLDPGQRAKLETVAKKVDAIIAKTRQTYADYGLESQATVDAWGSMFKSYVPLMREDKDGGMGIGQGFSVKGRETKGRTGSTRKVVDILANIAMQRERAIVRGEKNRVGQALLGLAQANPNADFWTVRSQAPTERVYDPKKNAVVDRPDMMFKQRDSVLGAKVKDSQGNVVEQFVEFNESDPRAKRMAVALKNLDAGNLEGLLGASAKITRYFSSVNTQYNPVFGVVNLVRDVQGAMINLGATPLAGKQGVVARNTLAALAGIYGDIRQVRKGGAATSKWAALWEQMQADGGTTGYRDLFKTSQDRADALRAELDPDAWMNSKLGKVFTANGTLKVPMGAAKGGADVLFGWLSDYNEAMENGVRLAAYKAALDAGMSRQQAASLSKNLTVNFNRKGQIGQQAGALYAFFNAAMQGSAKIGQTLFDMEGGDLKTLRLSPLGKKVVYGGMLLGSMQALMLAAAGFSDEDPPEFLRERSLIIPTGGKGYVSIPMPLGLHVIPGLGRHATEFLLSGGKKPAHRAVSVFGMFADAFNPIGNSGLSIQTIAPTAIDPLVALTENKDWTGRPIARVSSNKALPGHDQWKDTATGWSKVLAEGINLMSGGNKYVAGAFSPTPDQIDYLIAQATGGVGREASKVEQTIKSVLRGEELPTYKVPLVGRFYGNTASQASEGTTFYGTAAKLNELETELKGLRKDGKHSEAAALLAARPEARLIMQVNHAEHQIQKLKREKRELVEQSADRALIKAKELQITEVMSRTNRAAERLMAH